MKYLLSFTARYDGISRLKDNRWGFFPGVSVGWNIMEEDFWKESKVSDIVSNLKPRLSYGVNGNVNGIGNYEVYGEYAQVDAKTYGGATALYNKNCSIPTCGGNRVRPLRWDWISDSCRTDFLLFSTSTAVGQRIC